MVEANLCIIRKIPHFKNSIKSTNNLNIFHSIMTKCFIANNNKNIISNLQSHLKKKKTILRKSTENNSCLNKLKRK